MNPLVLVFSLLLLAAALVMSALTKEFSHKCSDQLLHNFQNATLTAWEERTISDFIKIKKQVPDGDPKPRVKKNNRYKSKQKSRSLVFNEARPPTDSRLNLYLLLFNNNIGVRFRIFAKQLLHDLYGTHNLYFSGCEERILEELEHKKDLIHNYKCIDELARLTLDDPTLDALFHFMLKGGLDQKGVRYPSLLYYVDFEKNPNQYEKRINLLFAPDALIKAILNHEQAANDLLKQRWALLEDIRNYEEHYEELAYEESIGRKEISAELKKLLDEIILTYNLDATLIDSFSCHMGNFGSTLLIYDENSHISRRERIN